MTKTTQHGYIEDGKLHILNRDRMSEDLRQFKDMDVVIVVKKMGKRSTKQNRYYWGIVVQEIRLNLLERGYRFDSDTLHEYLKQKFNPAPVVIEGTGERLDIGGTTTEMNKDEFSEYIERIAEWAATSLDLVIPPPNTQTVLFEGYKKTA